MRALSLGTIGLALAAYLALGGLKDLRDRIWPKRWGEVEAGTVYRSGQLHRALVKQTLEEHRIRVIVDLTGENPLAADEAAENAAIRELGITQRRFPMNGNGTGDLDRVAGAVAALADAKEQGKPVLVHCNAGAQRTSSVVALYRLLMRGPSPGDVLDELRHYCRGPDERRVLIDFVNASAPEVAERLVRLGVLKQAPQPPPRLAPTD